MNCLTFANDQNTYAWSYLKLATRSQGSAKPHGTDSACYSLAPEDEFISGSAWLSEPPTDPTKPTMFQLQPDLQGLLSRQDITEITQLVLTMLWLVHVLGALMVWDVKIFPER